MLQKGQGHSFEVRVEGLDSSRLGGCYLQLHLYVLERQLSNPAFAEKQRLIVVLFFVQLFFRFQDFELFGRLIVGDFELVHGFF